MSREIESLSRPSHLKRILLGAGFLSAGLLAGWVAVQAVTNQSILIDSNPKPTLAEADSTEQELPLAIELVAYTPETENDHITTVRDGELERRDTLSDLLDRLEVPRPEANSALYALFDTGLVDPRRVKPGLHIKAYLESIGETANEVRLAGLTLKPTRDSSITISRDQNGDYKVRELKTKVIPQIRAVRGEIETTLYNAALDNGARDQQVVDFASIYAYDIDFQRELRQGDKFEIVYEVLTDERGDVLGNGEVLYASFDGAALTRSFYRYTPSDDGMTDYFDPKGESARKFLMKTPINGARLSSHFGMRRHPISGYSRLHKGTDFAAPTGTPIMAAGNGTIERASRYGGYGNYVRIRHANGYATAYAHMSRYGPGVKSGRKIRQGQIVGYVGSTGASTGPHLHYEVLRNGKHLNAMNLKLPTGRILDGKELELFQRRRSEIDAMRGLGGSAELQLASASTPDQLNDR